MVIFRLGTFSYSINMKLSSDESSSDPGSTFDAPAAYQVTVKGIIAQEWSARLEGMTINCLILNNDTPLAILTGELTDQAALTGVLNTLYELHLPLIAVNRLPSSRPGQHAYSLSG